MAIDVNYFLKQKFNEFQLDEALKTDELYRNIGNEYFKNLLAILHQEFNRLLGFMYNKTNNHFNADQSRDLIAYIKLYEDMKYILKDSPFAFEIKKDYEEHLKICNNFLVSSGGSEIPENLEHIKLVEYEPIFNLTRTAKVNDKVGEKRYPLTIIGEGSYAKVFKYNDEFYDKDFIIKQAKKNLNEKELIRFKKEFTTMKELNSPYILKVYRFDNEKNEYYADYMDQTLYDYIIKNNTKIDLEKRINITWQIFKAFSYIHKKGYLHRDISLTNVLIKKYEDTIIIKIADFGLVKEKNSNLTSLDSEIKGSLNDPHLEIVGYSNYDIIYETYALTRLILFVMTGKSNIEKLENKELKEFVLKGTSSDISIRFKDVDEMKKAFKKIYLVH